MPKSEMTREMPEGASSGLLGIPDVLLLRGFQKILAMSEEVPDRFTGEAIFVVLLRNRSFRCGINIP